MWQTARAFLSLFHAIALMYGQRDDRDMGSSYLMGEAGVFPSAPLSPSVHTPSPWKRYPAQGKKKAGLSTRLTWFILRYRPAHERGLK